MRASRRRGHRESSASCPAANWPAADFGELLSLSWQKATFLSNRRNLFPIWFHTWSIKPAPPLPPTWLVCAETVVGDASLVRAVDVHHQELRVSRRSPREEDLRAVRRPGGGEVGRAWWRQPAHVRAIGIHQEDIRAHAVAIEACEEDLRPVGRPGGGLLRFGRRKQKTPLCAVGVHAEKVAVATLGRRGENE